MEPTSYTKNSSEPAQLNDKPLPDPKLDEFIKLCEYYLPQVLSRPGYQEDLARDRCHAEFDLDHPERVPVTYPKELIDEIFACCENLEPQRLASGNDVPEFVL
jgi:hypothetical protein